MGHSLAQVIPMEQLPSIHDFPNVDEYIHSKRYEEANDIDNVRLGEYSLRATTPFLFNEVSLADIEEELNNLNVKKSSTLKNIPAKILKISRNSCSETLPDLFNKTVLTGTFPNELKLGNVTPVFKKENPLKSKKYRPVSVLPVVSKIFERITHKQMSLYVDNFLSPYLCGYRKGLNTQQALLSLIEKWKNILDKKGYGGAVLMDLSKAIDNLNHDLLMAKLNSMLMVLQESRSN